MQSKGSVTHFIERLKAGDDGVAQQELWDRYFKRLVGLARQKLRYVSRREADEEDVALSALNSFFVRVREGRFPQLRDRTNLWPLLVKITVHKAINQAKRERAEKRGGGRVRGESVFAAGNESHAGQDIEAIAGEEPTPAFAAQVAEQCQRLYETLDDPVLRRIARMKLEGYTSKEIAQELDVVERTVERKLKLIRKQWSSDSEQ